MRFIKQQTTNLRNATGEGIRVDSNNQAIIDTDKSLTIPKGTTAERPTIAQEGQIRYNTDSLKFEYYENGSWTNSIDSADQVYYVSQNGSDNFNGKTIGSAFQTIEYALTQIPEGSTLHVKAGDYTLNNPVSVPKNVGIIGDSLRTVTVRAGNPTQDMFYVNNGSYLTQITFKDHESPAAAIAFNPDGSAGEIFQSPYVQNCSSITTTGTGMRVDGRHADGLKSMVVDAFTQYNQGGIGIHMLYLGNTQLVSVFTICCETAILCENGGFCSLTNSNSSFGKFGLRADGISEAKYYGTVAQTILGPTFAGDSIFINNLVERPNSGDAVDFGTGEIYTISTASDVKLGDKIVTGPYLDEEAITLRLAKDQIIDNKDQIIFDTISYLNTQYPTFDYDQSKCARDIGLILDAVTEDMVLGTNYQSIVAGRTYLQNAASTVITDQKTETVDGILYARARALDLITAQTTEFQRVGINFDTIVDIINNGESAIPSFDFVNPTNVIPSLRRAKDILQLNRNFYINEGIGFIEENYPDLVYNESICRRDIGYIIDAITYDILYQGNSQTISAAEQYYSSGNLQVGSGEQQATIDTFKYIRKIASDSVLNIPAVEPYTSTTQDVSLPASTVEQSTRTKTLFSIVTSYLESGNYINGFVEVQDPDFSAEEQDAKSIRTKILDAKSKIQVDTIDYINENFQNLDYDQVKCSRDVGIIIDSVVDDMIFSTNYKTVLAGSSYYRATASAVLDDQKLETVKSIEFVKEETLSLISADSTTEEPEYQRIENNFDIILDIFENGETAIPSLTFPSPTDVDPNKEKARDIIQANKQFIIEEGIAYISNYYSGLVYDESKCREDINYILDAVIYDVIYRGNSQTISAADEYYSGGALTIPTSELDATINTYRRIKNVISDCVVNMPVNTLNTTITQDTTLPAATSNERFDVEELFDLVIELLQNGYVSEVTLDETVAEEILASSEISFHQYSLITASGHTFEWVGAGTNINSALPYEGGRPILENQVVESNGGKVYYTGTDQEGDFRIGGELTINRTTGTIEGTTFDRSLFAVLTPYILAIED